MTTTTPHRFVRPKGGRREAEDAWLQVGVSVAGGALLFLVAAFALSTAYSLAYLGRVLPGVSVAGVDLSGLSTADAVARLNNTLTYPYSGRIVFRDGASVWMETPSQLGLVLDATATADAALSFGRSANLFQNIHDQLDAVQAGVDLSPVSIFDQRVAHNVLQDLATKIDRPVQEASLQVSGLQVSARPGQASRTLDVDSTLIYLSVQLQSFRDGQVPLVITGQAPDITDSSAQAAAAQRLLSAPMVLSLPNAQPGDPGPWQIEPAELGSMLQVARVSTATGSQFLLQLDPPALQKLMDGIAAKINRSAQNARYTFNDKTGQIELFQPSVVGLTMDEPGSMALVQTAVAQGQQAVTLKVTSNQPAVGDAENAQHLGITQNIETYTSYFRGSSTARLQNIQAAADRLNGVLVAPGETFSMGQHIGDISLNNGFAEALIIYNGQTITGVGGGVCQVSTTLFRAVFFAGLPVNERHAHAYRVFYYEQTATGTDANLAGLDATVYFPLVDFKFTNDTPYWLLMETQFNPRNYSLTWKLYSTSDGRTVNYETSGPTNIVPALPPVIQLNPLDSPGEIKHVDYAAEGANVTVNRVVTRDGKILFADNFTTQYEPWADVCEYGPKTKNPEKILKKMGLCQA